MRILVLSLLILFTGNISSQNDATIQAKKYFNSGAARYENGDYTKAIEDFSKALEFRTKITDSYLLCNLYLNRALSRMYLGSADGLADANEAVRLKPEFSRAFYIRALIQKRIMHDYDKALSDIDSALSFKPEEPDFLFLKSNCYREKKQPEEALKIMTKLLEIDPKNQEALKQHGSIYMELKKYDESAKDFLKVLEYNPNDFASLCDLASALCEQKKFDEALSYYLRAIAADSTEAYVVYNNIGYFINIEQKDYVKAIEYFDKSVKQNPKFAFGYSNRGYAKYMMGDLKAAMKDIHKSIEIMPKNSYAYKNKALVLIAENKISSACAELKKANELGYTQQYDEEVNELIKKHCK